MKENFKSKETDKHKKQYTYEAEEIERSIHFQQKNQTCPNCNKWELKTKELIWGYEQLAEAKENELQTLTNMINKLDDQLNKFKQKNDSLTKRLQHSELEIQQLRSEHLQCQKLIRYYKDREVDLLTELKTAQNQLFKKNVQITDEIEVREQKIETEVDPKNKEKNLMKNNTEPQLIPIIKNSQSIGKLLQKSLTDIEKMGRDKLVAQLKHRMAVLKAVELSVLK